MAERKMNEYSLAITPGTVIKHPANHKATIDYGEIKWWQRIFYDLGVYAMADAKPAPPEFRVTYATVSIILAILGSMAALWWFTWTTANQSGYERGRAETERQVLKDRLNKAEADAAEAKKFQIYAAAGSDEQNGHKPNQSKEKK